MEQNIRENGKMEKQMVKEHSFHLMENSMKGDGLKTKNTVLVNLF